MQIKPFAALYPNFDFIASPDSFCEDAKISFREFQDHGFYEKMSSEALFIYQIETNQRMHIGLIALNDIRDFFHGRVKKHEKTLSEREQHQMQLFFKWNAILKPVLLTYPQVPEISAFLKRFAEANSPMFSTRFAKEGETHHVWAVTNGEDIALLRQLFADQVKNTYIADGHHRTTTVALLHERLRDKNPEYDFNNLFCAYFDTDQLEIADYNRVVSGLKEVTITHFIVKLSQIFEIAVLEGPAKPRCKHELVMYLQKEWYSLHFKQSILDRYPKDMILLDANLLNELILKGILGIEDVRTDTRISYVEGRKGTDGIRKSVNENDERIGFMLYPVAFDDMMRLADLGESLPPKSTFFEPRMKSGMLVKMLK